MSAGFDLLQRKPRLVVSCGREQSRSRPYSLTVRLNFGRISRIVKQLEIDSRREAQKGQNLLLQRRKGRDMPLCEASSTNNRQGHFAEGFQQAFRRGLAGATCGIASE